MKIIDKTPLIDEKGNLGFTQRIQGILKFGLSWQDELQAQKAIVTFFDRNLEKGYILIRNLTLGQSDIMIPMILLGPAGIFVIHVTYLRGQYQATGDAWNVESGNQYKPAPINLIQRTARMTRALQVFIERQGLKMLAPVEPVLIAANPGLHLESVKPAIRVILIDGIKSFVSGLGTSGPVLNAIAVNEFAERILNPRPPRKEISQPRTPVPPFSREQDAPQPAQPASRARAIFNAAEEAKPFDPADFAMADEDADVPGMQASPQESNAANPMQGSKPKSRRILGMTPVQFAIVAALGLCLCIIVAGFVYFFPLGS